MLHLAVAFSSPLSGGRFCCVRGEGALIDDLHAGAAVFSGPPAAAGQTRVNINVFLYLINLINEVVEKMPL